MYKTSHMIWVKTTVSIKNIHVLLYKKKSEKIKNYIALHSCDGVARQRVGELTFLLFE